MIKGILFDLDNTLVDFMKMKEEAVKAAVDCMIDAGLPMSMKEAYDKIFEIYWKEGIEDQKIFNKFLLQTMGSVDNRILASGIVGYRKAKEGTLVLYPHVYKTLLELLKMGKKLAVVSDAPALQAWTRLAQTGLIHFFEVVVTLEDTGKRKPDPEPFRIALKKMGARPSDVVYIGDWPERDIAGAREVGMVSVFARYGDTFNTKNSGADFEVNDIEKLLEIVHKLDEDEGSRVI